jgi:hypothetical protein
LDDSASEKTLTTGAGLSYRLAERWTLDAGYQYTRTKYEQNQMGEPSSNVVFVGIAYNWPGASFTGWVGNPVETQGLPGASPLSLPDRMGGTSRLPSATIPSESSPFDGLTLP